MRKVLILLAAGIAVAFQCGWLVMDAYREAGAKGVDRMEIIILCGMAIIAALIFYLKIWGKVTKTEAVKRWGMILAAVLIVLGIFLLQRDTTFIVIDPQNISEITKPTYHEWMEELESGEREFENGERGSIK